MVKNNKKLREELAGLFKSRGGMTTNLKNKIQAKSKSTSSHNAREQPNPARRETLNVTGDLQQKKTKDKINIELGQFEEKKPFNSQKPANTAPNGPFIRKNLQNFQSTKNEKITKKQKHHNVKSSNCSGKVTPGLKKSPQNKGKTKSFDKTDKNRQQNFNGSTEKSETSKVGKGKTKKSSTNAGEKDQSTSKEDIAHKRKAQKAQKPATTNKMNMAKKRKLEQSDEPKRKVKGKGASASDVGIWGGKEIFDNETDTSEDYSDDYLYEEDSMLESDLESEQDDSYESSYSDEEDYEEFSYDTDETEDDVYSDDYSYDDDSSEQDVHLGDYDSDPDYELPKQEVEDLIVHKGLAVTYNLEDQHGVKFDESIEKSHIVELPNQTTLKTIKQHAAYDAEQLRSLETKYYEEKSISKVVSSNHGSNDEDCPQLVPIEKEEDDCFDLWTSGVTMDDEMFSDYELVEDSDESSCLSYTDVNRKYLQRSDSYESTDVEEENNQKHSSKAMKAFVIDATKKSNNQGQPISSVSNLQVQNQESSLSEIISNANSVSSVGKAKIFKAVLESFNDQSVDENNFQPVYNKNSEVPQKEPVPEDYNEVVFVSEEDCYEDPNPTIVSNFSTEKDFDESFIGTYTDNKSMESGDIEMEETENPKINWDTKDNTKRKNKFLTKFYNSIDSCYVLVLLKSPFFLYGTIKVTLIAGSTKIYGYILKAGETVALHSPRGCSSISLEPTTSSEPSTLKEDLDKRIFADIEALKDKVEFNPREVKDLLACFNPEKDAILLLSRNEGASKVKHIFQEHINENIYPAYIPKSRPHFVSETILDCMINITAEYALQIPKQWSDLQLNKNSKCMLIGGKSVGKSTLLRYLLNKHLSDYPKILLIDLDIGQPEVFAPQTVSCTMIDQPLLGPGFFGQLQPDKAFAVGHTNVVLCAHAYMRAVKNLLEFCKTEPMYRDVPWLVNTMGYNKGFGCELISVICTYLQPTDIVQLQSNKQINNFDIDFEPNVITNIPRAIYNKPEYETDCLIKYQPAHRLHKIPSAVLQESRYQKEWQMSAKDMRFVTLLARLSAVLPNEGEWLNPSQTFCQSLEKVKIVNLISRKASEIETLKSLECNLVYLCHFKKENEDDEEGTKPVECLGIGIVRLVDFHDNKIYIMPAMPIEKLDDVNCLALGEMPLPGSLLTIQNPDTDCKIPFVQAMKDEATSRAVKQFFYRT